MDKLPLRAIGLSNILYDKRNKKAYSVQFFDYDNTRPSMWDLTYITMFFPNDCLLYETKHGLHFISFALLENTYISKSRAVALCKSLDKQDYWSENRDLVLRVSPKWREKFIRHKREIISPKPKFKSLFAKPNGVTISERHLYFYERFLDLPHWVSDLYRSCKLVSYPLKFYHYKTRD